MEAATPERVASMLEAIQREETIALRSISNTQVFKALLLQSSKVTSVEVSEISRQFLADRRANVTRIIGSGGFSEPDVDFIFMPVAPALALTCMEPHHASILITLGLMEVLRLGCASGQLDSSINTLQRDVNLQSEIGIARHERMLESLRTMTRYLNACAVLYFVNPFPVPDVLAALDDATRHRVNVTLEAVLLFVLLHELGHVDFRKRHCASPEAIQWEFAIPEQLNARKNEELHADRFALQSVPPAFALPLLHAATFFLHLHNYVDVVLGKKPEAHPLSVNRLSAMYELASQLAPVETGSRAVLGAIDIGARFWAEADGSTDVPGLRLSTLQKFVESGRNIDWRPAQEALLLLASRPAPR